MTARLAAALETLRDALTALPEDRQDAAAAELEAVAGRAADDGAAWAAAVATAKEDAAAIDVRTRDADGVWLDYKAGLLTAAEVAAAGVADWGDGPADEARPTSTDDRRVSR